MRSAVIALALLLVSVPAMALDPSDAQQKCQDVRDAAEAGRQRAIAAAIPRKDPGETFHDATEACLKNIIDYSKFEFRMPSLGDLQGALKQMGQDLITKACQSASNQFNKAVQDATSQLGGMNTNVPGVGTVGVVGTGTGSVSIGSGGVTTSGAPVTVPQPQDTGIISSVINWFTGDGKGGKP
jgi:hypothetical protein